MIRSIRIDDNLLHEAVAFSWVLNLKLHLIIVADDQAASDPFTRMALGLSKPNGIALKILPLKDAIKVIQQHISSNLNVMVIVNSCVNALILKQAIPSIDTLNIGLLRATTLTRLKLKEMDLDEENYQACLDLDQMNVAIDYRLHYQDDPIQINPLLHQLKSDQAKKIKIPFW